ncbi:hypothetical protein ACIQU4_40975 [Streptomyces sp. NPDC090741]|uniref:hypothetical protein n=1 Tax=Streptomyces sp. NPDC090741 TaxID=3365967 RepID=UPI00382C130D
MTANRKGLSRLPSCDRLIAIARGRYGAAGGLQKTHLEHAYAAVTLNLIRLDDWWNGHPLDRTRVSHLVRLDLSIAA